MHTITRAPALVLALLLASCGGGGGEAGTGSTPVAAAPSSIAITETSAKPVAANAMATEQNLSAAQSGSLVTGVEVQSGTVAAGPLLFARVAAALAANVPGAAAPALATAATINREVSCTFGGKMVITGTVAGTTALVAGDNLTITATACVESTGGIASTTNGGMTLTLLSGSIGDSLPMHVVMNVVLNNLSVQTGSTTVTGNGDMRTDLTANTATSESLVVSGTSLASTIATGTTSRTITLKNYSQTVTLNGNTASNNLTATVETNSTRLGANGGSYAITTPTTLVWNTVTNVVSAGAVKVVGASGSQLLLTVGVGNTVSIQIDANGDGTYEKTLSSSVAELSGLL